MSNRHSYYDIPPIPTERLSMINEPHSREYGYMTGHAVQDDDVEMSTFNDKGAYKATEPLTRHDPAYQPYREYGEPLIQDGGHAYYPTRPPPAQIADPSPTSQQHGPRTIWQRVAKFPIFTYILTIVDISIFIWELVTMKNLTGSAFQTQPYFNPMLGPSTYVQIYLGARFTPCALSNQYVDLDYTWPCPNSTTSATDVCTLAELCNFQNGTDPLQIWRIVSACFMHAGFIHIIFNLLLQLTVGREVETEIGSIRYLVIYLLSGISGNLFGLNFAGNGVSSTGASGALFGIIAVNLVLFLFHKDKRRITGYTVLLCVLIGEVIVCLVLGLLPGLDNFAHIGGFVCGLLMAFILLENPRFVKQQPSRKMSLMKSHENYKMNHFWIWTAVRFVSLGLLIAWFVGLGMNIKSGGGNCSWCKYLSCLPVNGWCDQMELTTT